MRISLILIVYLSVSSVTYAQDEADEFPSLECIDGDLREDIPKSDFSEVPTSNTVVAMQYLDGGNVQNVADNVASDLLGKTYQSEEGKSAFLVRAQYTLGRGQFGIIKCINSLLVFHSVTGGGRIEETVLLVSLSFKPERIFSFANQTQ